MGIYLLHSRRVSLQRFAQPLLGTDMDRTVPRRTGHGMGQGLGRNGLLLCRMSRSDREWEVCILRGSRALVCWVR